MDVEETRKLKRNVGTSKFTILAENLPLDSSDLLQYLSNNNLSISELGKQLIKAATEGNVEEIRTLMSKGAPFTADWLGTSPLHMAAQNNHLPACEMLLRAGMSKDARTKVDRTPLHMAAYEGHLQIVECLLKHGADFDCKDLLHMTPLHWAAQNGHAEVATMLIRYGAATNISNKFNLTPADIALQINRPDIVQIIQLSIRDPLAATQTLALELISEDNSTDAAIEPIVNINLVNDNNEYIEDDIVDETGALPIETIMTEDDENAQSMDGVEGGFEGGREQETINNTIETEEAENNHSFSESIKLLQQHGITMLPVDDSNILNSVMENGHSVVLTEAGKQALNSIKTSEAAQDLSEYLKPKATTTIVPKKKKIITLTPEEFLAMTSNGTFSTAPNILKQVNSKVLNSSKPKTNRIVMKKSKVVPIYSMNVPKIQKVESVESLLEQLHQAHALIESYKRKLLKAEVESARYKQQLKILLDHSKLSTS